MQVKTNENQDETITEKTSARVLDDGDPDNVFREHHNNTVIHVDPILLDLTR